MPAVTPLHTKFYVPPAQLWIGPAPDVDTALTAYLQQQYCAASCNACPSCTALAQKQFHGVCWIDPGGSYTKEALEPLGQMQHKQAADATFFFVLKQVDQLTPTCANSLLKKLEEPNPGYAFILTTANKSAVIKTIVSRCLLKYIPAQTTALTSNPFFECFTSRLVPPAQFLLMLEQQPLDEKNILLLLQELLHYWILEYNKNKDSALLYSIERVRYYVENPPLPGSYKIVLKQLYLEMAHTFYE